MCPDTKDDIYFFSNFENPTYASVLLKVLPNYDIEKNKTKVQEELRNFIIGRY